MWNLGLLFWEWQLIQIFQTLLIRKARSRIVWQTIVSQKKVSPFPGLSDHQLTTISNCSHKYFTKWDYATWFIDADCVVRHDVVAVDNDNGDNGHNAVTSDFRRALLRQTWGQKRDVTNGQIYHGGTKAGPHSRRPGPRTGRILCHLCENVKIYPLLSIAFWWMDARWGWFSLSIVWCLPTSGVQWCRTSNKNFIQR